MTKDSFRGKRCLVFWAFSKVLAFASHEWFFCLALSAVPYPFLIVITGLFLWKKKKIGMIMNFPGESPSAASLWYTIHLVYQVLTTIHYPTEVSGNCLMSNSQTWDCTYELGIRVWSRYMGASAELHACGWAQSGFGPADFSKITEHINLGAGIASLLSVLCSLCSAIPFLKGSESAHSPTSLFNKNYFLSQLQAAKKINLNFP